MPARISAHMHTTVLQDRSHAVTQLSLFDQRGRAAGRAGAKTLHFACVFLRQQPSQRRASAAVRWRVGEAGYSRPCCSSRSDALLRDLEWESKPDFFIERHCKPSTKLQNNRQLTRAAFATSGQPTAPACLLACSAQPSEQAKGIVIADRDR